MQSPRGQGRQPARTKTFRLTPRSAEIHVQQRPNHGGDLGLPAYSWRAQLSTDKDNDKSADIHMGFGEWGAARDGW